MAGDEAAEGAGVPAQPDLGLQGQPASCLVGLSVGPSGDPRGVGVSYERGTPVCQSVGGRSPPVGIDGWNAAFERRTAPPPA